MPPEPDGPRGKLRSLPGETSCVRAREESAEVVVALRAAERRQERRTEGTNSSALRSIVSRGRIRPEVSRSQPPGWLCASPLRSSDAVAAGGAESGIPGDTHEPRTDSNAGGLVGIPSGLARLNPRWCSTAGCGKPHVRWCGRTAGVTPPPTRCAPGRAHLLGGESPLHTRQGEVLARGKGVAGDCESEVWMDG